MMPSTWPVNWLSKQFRVGLPELVTAIKGNGKTTKETPTTITITTIITTTITATKTTTITNNKTRVRKLPGPMLQPQLRIEVILGIYQSATITTFTIVGDALQSVRSAKELVIWRNIVELYFQVNVMISCRMRRVMGVVRKDILRTSVLRQGTSIMRELVREL
ncbi:hypothetical protein Tco_1281563 [Tanacetum coccineum]